MFGGVFRKGKIENRKMSANYKPPLSTKLQDMQPGKGCSEEESVHPGIEHKRAARRQQNNGNCRIH
jgi:hypothetical protein